MITVKTAENTLTDIGEVYVKTAADKLTKIAEGYQVVSVNGEKRLIPVFLSGCKHNYVISDELSYGASCTEDGLNVYVCTKCGESYSETGESAYGHNYVDDICQNCGDCLHHFDETVYVKVSSFYHSPSCAHCGEVGSSLVEHGVDHYEDNGSTRVPVCICGFEFDPEPVPEEPDEHECIDDGIGYCTVCGRDLTA